jgi:peptide/nickel transport system permease protein
MIKYIIKRILLMIPVLFCVAVIIFSIMYFVPGDPAQAILGSGASQEALAIKREELGLNEPFLTQLGNYLYNIIFKFDFGNSYQTNTPVVTEILTRFPRTLTFAICCMIITVIVGIPLGVSAAVHRGGWIDRLCTFIALLGVSLPDFWVGLMLALIFGIKLGILPAYGIGGISHYILPAIAGSLGGVAMMTRQTRSSMLEVIHSDYVTTARAKGLGERVVLYKHALPNALIPLIMVLGGQFGQCLGGAIIIESVFSIPGLGTYLTAAVSARNYPAIRGCVLFLAFAFGMVMLLVDVIFAFVDPRIKAQYENESAGLFRRKGEKV